MERAWSSLSIAVMFSVKKEALGGTGGLREEEV